MIDVIATAAQATQYNFAGKVAIVIDVLRATTVMTIAIHNGAQNIRAVKTPEEAFKIKELSETNPLLGGERNADKIEGFDLDNSPLNYTPEVVADRQIVMTTTNGTQAIAACAQADKIYIASLLNTNSTIAQIYNTTADIIMVCAGTNGTFCIEDGLCAGILANQLYKYGHTEQSDFAHAMRILSLSGPIIGTASQGEHFARLKRKGYGADLNICLNTTCNYEALICENSIVHKAIRNS